MEQKGIFDISNSSSPHALASVVQPETNMRIKTDRSQEPLGNLEEDESQGKGNITNDNSA